MAQNQSEIPIRRLTDRNDEHGRGDWKVRSGDKACSKFLEELWRGWGQKDRPPRRVRTASVS